MKITSMMILILLKGELRLKLKIFLYISILGVILLLTYFWQRDGVDEPINKNIIRDFVSPSATFIKEKGINLEEYGVKGDGVTDDTENFQLAIDDAVRKKKILIIPAKTYKVSPLKYRETDSSDWWCLRIPSESQIYFEEGAIIKLVDDAPEWTRVFVMDGVSNINIYGNLEIDGSAETVTNGNEHMAGIFIYDSKNVFIESAYSHNCYGDNLFIGGLENQYSENIKIKYFKGVIAGRKNLVIHYVDKLHIETAILDNSKGGVDGKWTGENSLDLEPDDYLGKKKFYQRIDYLSTYGKGNDFTIGTKKKFAKKWVLDIGDFTVILMDGSIQGLLSYACTVKIDKLIIQSSNQNNDIGIKLSYSAFWEIKEAYFIGGKGHAIFAKEEKGEKPNLILGKVFISKPEGKGIELWGSDAKIDYLEINTIKERGIKIFATNKQEVEIKSLLTRNSGREEIVSVSDYGFEPIVRINKISVSDNRLRQVKNIIYLDTQKAVEGFEIESIQNYDKINVFSYGPTVTRKK